MSKPIRVVIADDHPMMRNGIRASIGSQMEIVGEASDGHSALATIKELQPDIALLDMEMPLQGGLQVARATKQLAPKTKIIFLTVHKNRDIFRSAIEAGASGYLLKDDAPETILEGLRAVAAGRPYFSATLTAGLAEQPKLSPAEESLKVLTSTERHIVAMIASSKTSKEIGVALSLHHRTIENHRTNICRKLNLNGPSALLRFALRLQDGRCA